MATFKLDGQDVPFEPGDTIIRAAWRAGIEIPHYCWHPGLSVAANCRMCLVEIRSARPMALPILAWDAKKAEYVNATKPKLQPACQIVAQEGMEVYAANDHAREAQASTQEFLLLNHPVDCPICDQAGECKLQDYWLTSQQTPAGAPSARQLKRKRTEPVHKPKGVRFGETIVYDAERCILCTRCIRFCDEVAKDHVLDMRERGNQNEIVLSPGRELDHAYSLMTEHVCPVGALTSRDFRFKARVWFLKSAPGVCTGCATGCNTWIDYDPRYQRVYRLRPRDNEAVNQYWMCDDGMLSYHRYQRDRVITGRVRSGGVVEEVSRDAAVDAAARVLAKVGDGKLGVVLSAQLSSEDNYVAALLAKDVFATEHIYLTGAPGWKGDDILRHPDANPNRAGAIAVASCAPADIDRLARDIEAGEVEAVLSIGSATEASEAALAPLANLAAVGAGTATHVNLTSETGLLVGTASIVIPVTCVAESSGTFVNAEGTAQTFRKAVEAPGGILPAWHTLLEIGRALGWDVTFSRLGDVRDAMPRKLPTESDGAAAAGPPA